MKNSDHSLDESYYIVNGMSDCMTKPNTWDLHQQRLRLAKEFIQSDQSVHCLPRRNSGIFILELREDLLELEYWSPLDIRAES